MVTLPETVRCHLFGIDAQEVTFTRRGFPGQFSAARPRLEGVAQTFLGGYNTALQESSLEDLAQRLDTVDLEPRGFAYEGAAMALALLDLLTPWRRDRVAAFLEGRAARHTYMVHAGIGMAHARLRMPTRRLLRRLDPLLRWLAVDGYGFHEGFFHWHRAFERQAVPRRLTGYSARAFDQGLGRCLWFVRGGMIADIAATIRRFADTRHADVWSGIGLACAYAGGISREDMETLLDVTGPLHPHLAQGVTFAAQSRERAGNPAPHTELACRVLCGMSARDAAELTRTTLAELPPAGVPADGEVPAYQVWRQHICDGFAAPRRGTSPVAVLSSPTVLGGVI